MSAADVRDAYGRRAVEYADFACAPELMAEPDRNLVARWAAGVDGLIIDAGCGPGQWTDFLRRSIGGPDSAGPDSAGPDSGGPDIDRTGSDDRRVEGVDLVPEFVDIARTRFPANPFRVARLDALGVADASVDGILSWYSIIHTEPAVVPGVLAEFARCLRGGGSLLLGMARQVDGSRVEAFPHAVTTAYFWPVDVMSRLLTGAGFHVEEVETRDDPGHRPHAALVARRVLDVS
ncbi:MULTISPECIES: class I SAM-dependent methyltransferase [Prauserella salsuginis group]|uniref:SAM-dependent methyltransferase n=2 Tax=Prauserella salsuginis group TaxID=2893672 RepID=A0A839XM01_9PSEU|nr:MULTISPECIES: class I SAM-dependent methyltransferase [Prauserella salsuginis group]MBB3661788.1 SAM-dependent methyltransferase [Prauserella sediminis]MCR3722835.1 Methyltransferase domain-containing protein [Prauserella flava]MCR3737110.1 Methyltransferase domain-containing protein [Prauserella salsuginis]